MIEIRERNPLPEVCRNCEELKECGGNVDAACYNCDYALERFEIIHIDSEKQQPL